MIGTDRRRAAPLRRVAAKGRHRARVAVAAAALALGGAAAAVSQPMNMSATSFLAARLEPQNVVPPSKSTGSGTGVFFLAADGHRLTLTYRLTYASLSDPNVRSIALRNFGAGKEGAVVHRVCGEGAERCPEGRDATLTGSWTSEQSPPLTPALVPELANRRVYVEIETGAGKEIRAQLSANPFMMMAREAGIELRPNEPGQTISGTAALRMVQLGPNRVEVGVLLTVAGASADPSGVALGDAANRLSPLRMQRSAETKAGRTFRTVLDSRTFKDLTARRFQDLLSADTLTLTVSIGSDPRTALSGTVVFVK